MFLVTSKHCLMNIAILCSEQEIFLALPFKNLLTLSSKIRAILPSHRLGSVELLI